MESVGSNLAQRVAVAVVAMLAASACSGGKDPAPPPPPASVPLVPGATQVTGRERLSWEQDGDAASYIFRAYVDGQAVDLSGVTCDGAFPDATCSAPLPPLMDGVRSVALATVIANTGVESERSAPLTLQKITTRAARTASALPDAGSGSNAGAFWSVVPSGATADVVARDVRLPAQLAPLPDGRLLVAEAGGRVRVVHPETPAASVVALESGTLLDPAPAGAFAIAAHPRFAETHHVFVADLYAVSPDRVRVRVVRMREVGERLGEPATIIDAPVVLDGTAAGMTALQPQREGPRLAFGPDSLLYLALPPGAVFDGHPAASRPLPAILRVTADGRTPAEGALPGVTSHPLGFAWDPATGALLGLMAEGAAGAALLQLDASPSAPPPAVPGLAPFRVDDDGRSRLLRMDARAGRVDLDTPGLAALAASGLLPHTVRLAVPTDHETMVLGVGGHLTDLVSGAGAIYAVVSDGPARQGASADDGVVLRVRP